MDDRDIYEISFDFSGATGDLDELVAKLEAVEKRIVAIFENIEKAAIGSATKATAELGRLDKAISDSLDNIQKKASGKKKPIVIVEKKDVDETKKNVDDMATYIGGAMTEVATKVEEQATEIAEDIANAFKPPPTVVTDTEVFGGTPSRTAENMNAAVFGSGEQTQQFRQNQFDRTEIDGHQMAATQADRIPGPVAEPQSEEALKRQQKEAELAERALIRLLAAELKVAAGADTITKAYIESAAATAKNTGAFLAQVEAIAKVDQSAGHLSQAQVKYAIDVATTKNEINKLNRELQDQAEAYDKAAKAAEQQGTPEAMAALEQEVENREELLEKIDLQVGKLRFLEDAQQKAAAASQRQAEIEKAGQEAIAQIRQNESAKEVARLKQEQAARDAAIKQRELAGQQFNKIARSLSVESTALNALAQKYGIFEATIRKSGHATNELEKEIQDIIKQSPQLQRVVDQLTDGIEEFTIKADPSTFRSAQGFFLDPNDIRQLGFAFQRFGITGVAAFGEIYAAIGPVGIAVGIVTVGIVSLTKAVVQLGRAGVEAFKKMVVASVELATKRETLGAGFEAYLENADAAITALEEVDRISRELGIDISPVAQSFLPEIGSIADLQILAQVAQSLALSKPGKTIEDTTVALRELRAGDITSLRKQFEVPDAVLEAAKKAIDQTGDFVAGLRIIDEWQQRTGRSAQALGDTFEVAKTRGQEYLNTLGRDFGAPIVASLESGLNELIGIVTDKEGLLRGFAGEAGQVLADVIDRVSGVIKGILEDVDEQALAVLLGRIQRIGETIALAVESVGDLETAGDGILSFSGLLTTVANGVEKVTNAASAALTLMVAWAQGVELIYRTLALAVAYQQSLQQPWNPAAQTQIDVQLEGLRNLNVEAEATMNRLVELGELYANIGQPSGEFARAEGGGDTGLLDDILSDKRQETVSEVNEALDTYVKELEELRQDVRDKVIDLSIKLSDDLLDFLEETARKQVELARKNREDLIDLEDEFNRKVRDAKQDLADDLEDADVEAERNRLKQSRDFADKRLEIEEDYQRKIAEIRRKYAFDLEEAARQNDAIAYLRLLRKREFDLNEARIDRDEALADVDTDEAKKIDEAARKRREDEEDARTSYKRKIRDLKQWLEDQESEIRKNYKREKEELVRQEEEKRKEIMKAYERDLRDINTHYERRIEELNKKYAEEYDLIQMWEQKIVDMQQQIRSQFGFTSDSIGKNAPGGSGGRGLGDQPTLPGDQRPRGDHGGGTTQGQGQGQHSVRWYRWQVERLARLLGYDHLLSRIPTWDITQLMAAYNSMLRTWQQQNGLGGAGQSGGGNRQSQQSLLPQNPPGSTGGVAYRQPAPAASYNYTSTQRSVVLDMSVLDTSLLKREMVEMIKIQLAQALEEAF